MFHRMAGLMAWPCAIPANILSTVIAAQAGMQFITKTKETVPHVGNF